jgi:hypothetical protein
MWRHHIGKGISFSRSIKLGKKREMLIDAVVYAVDEVVVCSSFKANNKQYELQGHRLI